MNISQQAREAAVRIAMKNISLNPSEELIVAIAKDIQVELERQKANRVTEASDAERLRQYYESQSVPWGVIAKRLGVCQAMVCHVQGGRRQFGVKVRKRLEELIAEAQAATDESSRSLADYKRMLACRVMMGLTWNEIANDLNITVSAIMMVKSGKRRLGMLPLQKLDKLEQKMTAVKVVKPYQPSDNL